MALAEVIFHKYIQKQKEYILVCFMALACFASKAPLASSETSCYESENVPCATVDLSVSSPPEILSLENTIERALAFSDKILDAADSVFRSKLQISIAESQFGIQMRPNGKFGYACVNQRVKLDEDESTTVTKIKPCYGTGLTFSKKFYTGQEITFTPNVSNMDGERWGTGASLSFSQPLFRGFSSAYQLNTLNAAKFSYRKAVRSFYSSQINSVLKAVTVFYEALKQREIFRINQESSARLKAHLETAKLKERLGIGSELDIYRIEIELSNAEESEFASLEKLKDAEDKLKDLIGLPLDSTILPEEKIVYNEPSLTLSQAISIANMNRIEIDQAADNLDEANRLAIVAKHQTLPDLNLLIEYSTSGYDSAFWNFYCCVDRKHNLNLTLTTNSDVTSRKEMAHYQQARVALATISRAYENTRSSIELDVRKTVRNYQTSWDRLHNLEEKLVASEASLRFAQLKYERGLADNFDVIQAEKNIRSSKTQVFSMLIDYILSEYKLYMSLGTLIDKPCI